MDRMNRRYAMKSAFAGAMTFVLRPAFTCEEVHDPELAAARRDFEWDPGLVAVRRDEHGQSVLVITN